MYDPHSSPTPHTLPMTKPATVNTYTLSLHDALPIFALSGHQPADSHRNLSPKRHNEHSALQPDWRQRLAAIERSEEHTSELQSRPHLVCRLLLEKKNKYTSPI